MNYEDLKRERYDLANQCVRAIEDIEIHIKKLKYLEERLRPKQLEFNYDKLVVSTYESISGMVFVKETKHPPMVKEIPYYDGLYNNYHHKLIKQYEQLYFKFDSRE